MAQGSTNCDVLVIGAGIIGASIAWRLSQRGVRVTVVDARKWGGEASWAGAGMLVPGSEYDEASEAMRFALQSLTLYPDFVRELTEVSGLPIDFSLCGSIELAGDERELEAIGQRAKRQGALQVRAERLSRSDLAGVVPGIDQELAGGFLYPREGQVDPRTVTGALRVACERGRVTIREHDPVVALEWESGRLFASLGSGDEVEAACGVLSAGAWASQLGKYLPSVFPVKGHLIGYEMAVGSLPHVLRHHHTYLVQRLSGYTVAGTNEERAAYNREVNAETCAEIAVRARRLWAGLPEAPTDAWVGFRPGVNSEEPYLGRWQDTPLWLAYGHYRNGILLAPATAERLCRQILASLEAASS